jgi:hypothetical protein
MVSGMIVQYEKNALARDQVRSADLENPGCPFRHRYARWARLPEVRFRRFNRSQMRDPIGIGYRNEALHLLFLSEVRAA